MAPYHNIRGTQPQLSDSDEEYDEVSTKLLDAEPWDGFSPPVSRRWTARSLRWPPISVILNIVLLGSLVTFSIIVNHFMQFRPKPDPLHNEIIRQTSEYSPIIDQVHIPLLQVTRNGSFVGEENPDPIYRQEASPEVDAAWLRLSNINPVPISSSDVEQLGYDPSKTARFPPEFGLGDDAHVARIEVFHQIHCLNWLRKELWFDHYFGHKFPDGKPNASHRAHQYHCLFILLEGLKCNANVEPYLHYWSDSQKEPFPDFNNRHQCRDFDTVLKFHEENSIDQGYFVDKVERPPGVDPVIMSHRFKVVQGLEEDVGGS